jgi:mRNA interferase MazF
VVTRSTKRRAYVPQRGDAVWLTLDPQAGHEQAGRRPAVVVSPSRYNARSGLALFCPVTSRVKGYPFEVLLPSELPIDGVVLSDQVRSLDWRARKASRICSLPSATIEEVVGKLQTLLAHPEGG